MLGAIWAFIQDPHTTFTQHTLDFIRICVVAIALALVIGIPLGVAVAQRPIAAFAASNISGLARAVPTIVFFIVAEPFLHTGIVPATIALALLGIPPILLNTIAGLRGVDPAAVDAGRGMGMTPLQTLLRVQAPLVLPVMAAGVRTAAVQIVATAPLAAIIGAGGYGDYILAGINVLNYAELLAGAIPVIALALVTEIGLATVQRALTPAGLRLKVAPVSDTRAEQGQPAVAGDTAMAA